MTYRFIHDAFIDTATSEERIRDPEAGLISIAVAFIVPRVAMSPSCDARESKHVHRLH